MSVKDIEAGTISFAHLSGLTRISAAKADAPSDDKKDDENDKDEDAKKAAKADDDSDDASADDDKEEKDAAKAESDDEDEPKKDNAKKAQSEFQRGVEAANSRWSTVLASKSFAKAPTFAAHMLANSAMSASAIIGALRDAPATVSPDASRAARNPNLGTSAPSVAATTDTRWGAAFKRVGIV